MKESPDKEPSCKIFEIFNHKQNVSAVEKKPKIPVDEQTSDLPVEKKPQLQDKMALHLIKENKMGLFGHDIPQLLHITERDYNDLKGPVLRHLQKHVKNLNLREGEQRLRRTKKRQAYRQREIPANG